MEILITGVYFFLNGHDTEKKLFQEEKKNTSIV